MTNKGKKKKRIVIDVTEEEHHMIKMLAVKKNTTISKLMLQSYILYAQKLFPNCG